MPADVMTYVDHLQHQRLNAWEEAKAILERAVVDKRDLTGEERATLDRANTAVDDYDTQIKDYTERARREKEAAQARDEWGKIARPDVTDRRDEEQTGQLRSLLKGEIDHLDIDIAPARRERAALRGYGTVMALPEVRNLLARDLSLTAAAGGNTVPTSLARQLYDYLEVFSGMRRTNATILTTSSGEPLGLPKVTSHGTAAIVGEGTAIAEVDPAFGILTLTTYKFGQLLQASRELVEDTVVDLEGFISKDMGRALARATDVKYALGTGTNEPGGLFTACGTGVTAVNGTAAALIGWIELVKLVYSVNEEYRLNGAQWIARDATYGNIRLLLDSTGRPIWEPSTILGQPDRLLGYPVVADPNVAAEGTSAKFIGFGDTSAFVIRDVNGIRLESSRDYAFNTDQITYRATLRTSSGLLDLTGAFKAYVGGTA